MTFTRQLDYVCVSRVSVSTMGYRRILITTALLAGLSCNKAKKAREMSSEGVAFIEARFDLLPEEHVASAWGASLLADVVAASAAFEDPSDFNFSFQVMDTDMRNAFALPDGHIYMTTGLLRSAESCAEIVGILGHEVGHVIEHHAVERARDAESAGCMGDLIFGDGGGKAFEVGGMILGNTAFSRRDEAEADAVGVKLTASVGYDPSAVADFFGRLPGSDEKEASFWSTHPASGARIEAIHALIAALPPDQQSDERDCVVAGVTLEKVKASLR